MKSAIAIFALLIGLLFVTASYADDPKLSRPAPVAANCQDWSSKPGNQDRIVASVVFFVIGFIGMMAWDGSKRRKKAELLQNEYREAHKAAVDRDIETLALLKEISETLKKKT